MINSIKLATVNAYLRHESVLGAFTELETSGYVGRLDQTIEPQLCKGALVSTAELSMLHTVQNVVRLGRVTAVCEPPSSSSKRERCP